MRPAPPPVRRAGGLTSGWDARAGRVGGADASCRTVDGVRMVGGSGGGAPGAGCVDAAAAGRAAVAAEPMVGSGRTVGGEAIVGTSPGGVSGGSVGASLARRVGTKPGRVRASRSSASSRPLW